MVTVGRVEQGAAPAHSELTSSFRLWSKNNAGAHCNAKDSASEAYFSKASHETSARRAVAVARSPGDVVPADGKASLHACRI